MAEGLPARAPAVVSAPAPARLNVADHLAAMARRAPGRDAVLVARTRGGATRLAGVTYGELERRVAAIAAGLAGRGLRAGERACVLVRPGVDLVAIVFALFRAGAVPVLIDPGMGRANLLACVERTRPRAFLGLPAAQALRALHRRAFRTVALDVAVGARVGWGGTTLARLAAEGSGGAPPAQTSAEDEAAVLFTSGSTGPPKGVVYTHGTFEAQIEALKALYGFEPGEIDAACFPLFALFAPALGMTCAFPELDARRPASCDPRKVVECIRAARATTTFGSPAIWRRVVPWCIERGIVLSGLRRVLAAGAPVPVDLVEGLRRVLPGGAEVYTPYGATEALPVASISGAEVLGAARARTEEGAGTCVGRPAPGVEVRLIRISDEPLASWADALEVAPGEMGEVCVSGAVVTHSYDGQPEHTAAAKIRQGERVWHRMGDVGWRDADGRLWFCGRKSHRLETAGGTVLPVPVENVMNTHPAVRRSALVGVGPRGAQRAVLWVEPEAERRPRGAAGRAALRAELFEHARARPAAALVSEILFADAFPVDVRHNAKIGREELKRRAQARLS